MKYKINKKNVAKGDISTKNKLRNLAIYNGNKLARNSKKAIKGVAKFATRTAFKGVAGGLAAAVAAASGGGLAGALTAGSIGATFGGKLANKTMSVGSKLSKTGEWIDKQRDIANGNLNRQTARRIKEFKQNESNLERLRDKMTEENGGVIPKNSQVRNRMDSFNEYIESGMDDIGEIMQAQKIEEYIEGDNITRARQAAIIASIGKQKGITADVLNDEKKYKAAYDNMVYEAQNKGYTEQQAIALTNKEMNGLKVMYGIKNDMQAKPRDKSAKEKMKEAKAEHRAKDMQKEKFNGRWSKRGK